ncbi:MAG: DUF3027 domain-containing protein [Micrococcales bacterium]
MGDYLETIDELDSPGTQTHFFACKLKGYPDWRWAVTVFTDDSGSRSLSEINLLPSESSILAPAWTPWSERLADYKALQAELEAQAAAEAAEAAELEEETEDEAEVELGAETLDEVSDSANEEALEQESALTDVPVTQESQDEAADTSGNPAGFFRRKFLRRNKKRK